MSARELAIYRATQHCERNLALLESQLGRGAPRFVLDVLVELCGVYADQTGSTAVTSAFRARLSRLAGSVAAVPALQPVEITTMFDSIMTDQLCQFCSAPGIVGMNHGHEFEAHCSECYDGDPDAADGNIGHGRTAQEALSNWADRQDDNTDPHVGYWPAGPGAVAWQWRAESKRQADWTETATPKGTLWAPPTTSNPTK